MYIYIYIYIYKLNSIFFLQVYPSIYLVIFYFLFYVQCKNRPVF